MVQDAKIYFDQDMAEADVFAISCGSFAIYSARCPGKSTPNEDAAALIPFDEQSAVLVVADGMGGSPAGEQAASLAVQSLEHSIAAAQHAGHDLRTAILNGFEVANRSVQELGCRSATTMAAVEVQAGMIRPYHAGDSIILLTGQRGRIKLQTVSHSPVGYAVEAGILDENEAMHHEERHLVSNFLGTTHMRIEIGSALRMAPRDTLLLASDGLLDNLHIEEIVERLRKGPLKLAARRLAEDARRRMETTNGRPCKPDDLTLLAFRCGGAVRA